MSQKKYHVLHHMIFITGFLKNVHIQHERKRVDADVNRRQHVQWTRDAERPICCWYLV